MFEAVVLGVLAALSWSVHDVIARVLAGRLGPFRMAVMVMIGGGLALTPYVLWRGIGFLTDPHGLLLSLALGVAYGVAIGTIYKAFSLGPVSLVAPLTAAYPVLVVVWGLLHGLSLTLVQGLAVGAAIAGAFVIARTGHEDSGINAVPAGKMPLFIATCALCLLGFATAFIIGQNAAVAVGEAEAAWVSRLTGMLTILPFVVSDPKPGRLTPLHWLAVAGCAVFDVAGLVAVNASGHFPGREFAAIGVSGYGATAAILAALILKERISLGQWCGILLIVVGVATIAFSG